MNKVNTSVAEAPRPQGAATRRAALLTSVSGTAVRIQLQPGNQGAAIIQVRDRLSGLQAQLPVLYSV